MNFITVVSHCIISCLLVHDPRRYMVLCMFVSCLCVQLPSVVLAVHHRLLRSSCDWKVPKIVSMSTSPRYSCCILLAVTVAVLMRKVLLLTNKSQGVVVLRSCGLDY